MVRLRILLIGLVWLCSLIGWADMPAQSVTGNTLQQSLYERNLRAMQTYFQDENAYFEGFMLSKRYAEKINLIKEIEKTINLIDKFAMESEFIKHPEIAVLRAKAHLLYGIALAAIGEKKAADFQIGLANAPLPNDSTVTVNFKNEEIKLGPDKETLSYLEQGAQKRLNEYATVQIKLDLNKRQLLGNRVEVRMIAKDQTPIPEAHLLLATHASQKISQALMQDAQRETIYLFCGKYQIVKLPQNQVLAKFEIKQPTQVETVKVPAGKFPPTWLIIGTGVVTVAALGYFLF
ncbi:hypothetical protein L0128_09150 [candidate division KSB1 bacterium]|nr:hypothetical protein [candidate division KSB1 bacterium]